MWGLKRRACLPKRTTALFCPLLTSLDAKAEDAIKAPNRPLDGQSTRTASEVLPCRPRMGFEDVSPLIVIELVMLCVKLRVFMIFSEIIGCLRAFSCSIVLIDLAMRLRRPTIVAISKRILDRSSGTQRL